VSHDDDLFTAAADSAGRGESSVAPLAVRMRPRTLDEVVGQRHLLRTGSPLRQLVEGGAATSVIMWGPPGTGKTTLAYVISHATGRRFVELSAVTAGVKDVRAVIDQARRELAMYGRQTVLFIDEVHRFNKAQQDALLPAVENRWVTLVAATTENPSFSVVSPLLSRSLLLVLEPLGDDDVRRLVDRALDTELAPLTIGAEERDAIVRMAGGDARRALTVLEAAAQSAAAHGGTVVDATALADAVDRVPVVYDRAGDQHYDVISAFIKSVRGSDVDAALHYLARMIEAGEDPRFIARRLVISASEDIGMADPTALLTAVAAADAVAFIGMPEARLNLAQATIALALAPKSNAVITAIGAAQDDVRAGRTGPVPAHLRDAHYPGARRVGHGKGYVYSHDVPGGVAAQQYAPDGVHGRRYYQPSGYGREAAYAERLAAIRRALAGDPPDTAAPAAGPPDTVTPAPADPPTREPADRGSEAMDQATRAHGDGEGTGRG
jgi:putative ATPase